jgi:hypothetical protein
MAIGVIFSFPGGTTEQYDEVCPGLNNGQPTRSLADRPGGGCLSHTAGATPDGLCVLDVYSRYLRTATPMLNGTAANPATATVTSTDVPCE